MKRLIAVTIVLLIMLTGVHAGGRDVQRIQEHHEEQKIMVIDVNASKTKDISVPDGWHVADVDMVSYGHGYVVIVIVLERNYE